MPEGVSLEEFRQLYIDITNAIREVDENHIVYVEGNWYGTDFSGLTPPWDDNMSYSFHKYWGETTLSTIQSYISMSNQHGIPLWMGESGENSNHWYYEVFKLLEENDIGWNFWTHKKVAKISSPFSALVTPQYQTLIDYWSGNGSQPSSAYAEAALLSFATSLKIENCDVLPGVIASLTDPEYGEISKPYSYHSIPGIIPAVEYDIGAWGISYTDGDYYNNGDGNYNDGWTHRNDGVDIESNNGSNSIHPYNVGWTDAGEWLGYTIQDVTPGIYDLKVRVAASSSGGMFFVQLDGVNLAVVDVPSTGGWYDWQNLLIPDVEVSSGEQFLKIQIVQAGFNIERIKFESLVSIQDEPINVKGFKLDKPFPNPFNPKVNIKLSVIEKGEHIAQIFGIRGNLVRQIDYGTLELGIYDLEWNGLDEAGRPVESGMYFFKIQAGDLIQNRKMVLLK